METKGEKSVIVTKKQKPENTNPYNNRSKIIYDTSFANFTTKKAVSNEFEFEPIDPEFKQTEHYEID